MRIKLTLSLVVIVVGLFLLSIILVHPGPAVIGSIFGWILLSLLLVVFPAEKLSTNSHNYFLISFIGCLLLSISVSLLFPDHMDYFVYTESKFKYLWSMKEQVLLLAGLLFAVTIGYRLLLPHNKQSQKWTR